MNPEESNPTPNDTAQQAHVVATEMNNQVELAQAAIPQPEVDHSIIAAPTPTPVAAPIETTNDFGIPPEPPRPESAKLADTLVDMGPQKPANAPKAHKKGSKLPLFITLGVVGVAVLGLGIYGLIALLGRDNGGAKAEEGVKAFYLENRDEAGRFAIFNERGERLTDFVFPEKYDFVDGYAIAKNNDEQYGVVANTGKMSIPYGKYTEIERYGKNFIVKDEEEKRTLISGAGDVILEIEDISTSFGISYATSAGQTYVIDPNGEIMLHGAKVTPDLKTLSSSSEGFCANADKQVVCFDFETNKIVAKFESEIELEFSHYYPEFDYVYLGTVNFTSKRYIRTNEKLLEFNYYSVTIRDQEKDYHQPYFMTGYGDAAKVTFLDGSSVDTADYGTSYSAKFIDSKNFFVNINYTTDTANFVVNGKETTLENVSYTPSLFGDKYVITVGKKTAIYGKDLKKEIDLPDDFKSSGPITPLDANGRMVAECSYNYFCLLDDKYSIVAKFGKIEATDGKCYIISDGSRFGLANADGDEVVDASRYTKITKAGDYYIGARESNNDYELLNNELNVVQKECTAINYRDGYFEIVHGDKIEYASEATGEIFY